MLIYDEEIFLNTFKLNFKPNLSYSYQGIELHSYRINLHSRELKLKLSYNELQIIQIGQYDEEAFHSAYKLNHDLD